MGSTCSSGYPPKYTARDLVDLPLGQKKIAPKGCCPDIVGRQPGSGFDRCVNNRKFSWPKTGEFEWGGLGPSCKMCSNITEGYGCSSPCKGDGTIGGRRPTVKRIAYSADNTKCCLGRHDKGLIFNRTCSPDTRDTLSSTCKPIVRNFCESSPDRLWKDPVCQRLCSSDPLWCNNQKKMHCTPDKMGKNSLCRGWVLAHHGEHDAVMGRYCESNPEDLICSCLSSEILCPNKSDSKCIKTGAYKNYDMIHARCPDVINCTQFLSLSPNAQAVAVNVEQGCGQSNGQPTNVPNIPIFQPSIMIFIILFLLFTTIAILVAVYVKRKK